jgi:hypothetical protein
MGKVIYEVVEHDGGWAYRADGVYSETFANRQEAHDAAEQAAREQRAPGEDEEIEWEDSAGKWHGEHADGRDRPETDVKD